MTAKDFKDMMELLEQIDRKRREIEFIQDLLSKNNVYRNIMKSGTNVRSRRESESSDRSEVSESEDYEVVRGTEGAHSNRE